MVGRIEYHNGWLIDPGATKHITHRSDFLENEATSQKKPLSLYQMGRRYQLLVRVSIRTLPGGVKIKGVLYVPNFNYNLLSVRKLTKDLNCAVTFLPDFFVIQELVMRDLIGMGSCTEGLYRMGVVEKEIKALMASFEVSIDIF